MKLKITKDKKKMHEIKSNKLQNTTMSKIITQEHLEGFNIRIYSMTAAGTIKTHYKKVSYPEYPESPEQTRNQIIPQPLSPSAL